MNTCPTCGQPVRVHQSSEGTGCFVPEPSEEKIREAFEAWMHKVYVQPLLERWEEDEYYYAEQSTQDEYEAYLAGYSARPESEAERAIVEFSNAETELSSVTFDDAVDADDPRYVAALDRYSIARERLDTLARKLAGETTTKGE